MNPTLDEIEDNFCSEIKLILNDILGPDEYEDQKEDLIDSLRVIFQNRSRRIFMEQQMKNSASENFFSTKSMSISPCINIILGANNSSSFAYPQFPQNAQNPIFQSIPANLSGFNLPNYPNYPYHIIQQQVPQFFHQQPQINQQANFLYYGQPNPSLERKKSKKDKRKKKESHRKRKSSKSDSLTFEHKEGVEFNGIFNYLTKKTHGNIHENGTIEVTSNSINPINENENHPKNLLDNIGSRGYLSDANIKDIWIIFDFKSMKVKLFSYTMNINNSINEIRNWSVEVSDDKSSWNVIDKHTDDSSLSGFSIKTFDVQSKKFARFIRFSFHIDKPMIRNYAISIEALELYGKLKK